MQSYEIRKRFLDFFEKRGHAILPSASLVPQNDPSVLFNTAGMQPLVPYLMGQKHPEGSRLASCQKCVRTGDLEDIGDNRHFSFFEMLGNWSLGDYFKKEAISWSYEFLTSKDEGLGLDPNRLYVTIFEGDENAPYDQESKDIWMSLGIPEHRIYALNAEDNWWSPGDNGPCGPCSEMFYDMTDDGTGDLSLENFIDATKKETVVEIWNDVFMEYEKKDGKVVGKLSQKNVDTGAGLERLTAVMQHKKTAYESDILLQAYEEVSSTLTSFNSEIHNDKTIKSIRIVVDHFRSALFLVSDGVFPSNKDAGYVLRRLIRRGWVYLTQLNTIAENSDVQILLDIYKNTYKDQYPHISLVDTSIILTELNKFNKTLQAGLKEFEKGVDPFVLATTYGFPIEITEELANEKGIKINRAKFDEEMKAHQDLSRSGSEQKFKGGLANTNEKTVQLHTAHHLLLKALQEVLGSDIHQKGSNITEERLRIDFSFDRKMTDEEKARVEEIVNAKIKEDLHVKRLEMSKIEAEGLGAEMEFGAKYPDTVSVYVIEDKNGNYFSKEFCGGPHIEHTGVLGTFKIQKEEAVAQGVRRIKGILFS